MTQRVRRSNKDKIRKGMSTHFLLFIQFVYNNQALAGDMELLFYNSTRKKEKKEGGE